MTDAPLAPITRIPSGNGNRFEYRNSIIEGKHSPVSPAFNLSFDTSYASHGRQLSGPNDKLVIFGLPRSGNTWLQTCLSMCLDVQVIDPWFQVDKSGVGMCHLPVSHDVLSRTDFIHALCLIRDPRDIAASYFNFIQKENWRTKAPWFADFEEADFLYSYYFPRSESMYDFYNFWDRYACLNIPIVRYEDMLSNLECVLQRIFHLLGLKVQHSKIAEAISFTNIHNLSSVGVAGYEYVSPQHFGTGVSGGYKTTFSDKSIRQLNRRYETLLQNWGYE